MLKSMIFITTLLIAGNAIGGELAQKKQTEAGLYLTAIEANELVQTNKSIAFIDVRTRAEVAYLGMPEAADANIPYMLVNFDEWDDEKHRYTVTPNSNFLLAMRDIISDKGLNKDSTIILMCRSGSRSARAANLMFQAGYSQVYTMTDGFEGDKSKNGDHKGHRVLNGWKNANLPWTYKLDSTKLYDEM